jgi:carbon storage regulator
MLVLSRKPGEEILVGDNIRITVVEVSGGRAKIGIEAPADVVIHRSELREWLEADAKMRLLKARDGDQGGLATTGTREEAGAAAIPAAAPSP